MRGQFQLALPSARRGPPGRGSRGVAGSTGFLFGIALAALSAGVVLWRISGSEPNEELRIISQPTVVRQVQQLERLETVVYRMEKIIAGERGSRYLPQFLAGDRLLLIATGEVIAGVDLSRIMPRDVTVNERAVTLRMPKAEVFVTRIDNEQTRIYSRDTGLFSRVDPNLETEVRREAERQLRESSLAEGILETAEANARQTLTRFLEGFWFEQITIE